MMDLFLKKSGKKNGPMGCVRVVAMLDEYSQGELTPSLTREVEGHLGVCSPCRKELHFVDQVYALVGRMDRATPPPHLWQRVKQEISQPASSLLQSTMLERFSILGASGSASRRWGWLAPVAAAAALIAALGVLWPHPPPGDMQAPSMQLPRQTEVASYFSQAEQVSMFEPLADRVSMGAIREVSTRPSPGASANGVGGAGIDNAMIDTSMGSGMSEGRPQ